MSDLINSQGQSPPIEEGGPIVLSSSRQLFFDDFIFESIEGLVRKVHQPERRGIVLRPERPREGGLGIYWGPIECTSGCPVFGHSISEAVSVQGNVTGLQVRWRESENLGEIVGEKARLRFEMKNAVLYSFQFKW